MAQSKLKLNPSKIEFLLIGSKSREKYLPPLAVLDNEMNPADSTRNLGVFLTVVWIFVSTTGVQFLFLSHKRTLPSHIKCHSRSVHPHTVDWMVFFSGFETGTPRGASHRVSSNSDTPTVVRHNYKNNKKLQIHHSVSKGIIKTPAEKSPLILLYIAISMTRWNFIYLFICTDVIS